MDKNEEILDALVEQDCIACGIKKNTYSIRLLLKVDNEPQVVAQAQLLQRFFGAKLDDRYCEECFWK